MLLSVALTAQAQKPIKIVIPFTPGGVVDASNRIIHSALERELGQQVNIETRPGAGGQIGLRYMAQNKTDDVLITFICKSWGSTCRFLQVEVLVEVQLLYLFF